MEIDSRSIIFKSMESKIIPNWCLCLSSNQEGLFSSHHQPHSFQQGVYFNNRNSFSTVLNIINIITKIFRENNTSAKVCKVTYMPNALFFCLFSLILKKNTLESKGRCLNIEILELNFRWSVTKNINNWIFDSSNRWKRCLKCLPKLSSFFLCVWSWRVYSLHSSRTCSSPTIV